MLVHVKEESLVDGACRGGGLNKRGRKKQPSDKIELPDHGPFYRLVKKIGQPLILVIITTKFLDLSNLDIFFSFCPMSR